MPFVPSLQSSAPSWANAQECNDLESLRKSLGFEYKAS